MDSGQISVTSKSSAKTLLNRSPTTTSVKPPPIGSRSVSLPIPENGPTAFLEADFCRKTSLESLEQANRYLGMANSDPRPYLHQGGYDCLQLLVTA